MATLPKHKIPVECPLCLDTVLATQFPDHCSVRHGISPLLQCVWCLGHYHLSPLFKDAHTALCFRRFLQERPPLLVPYSPDPVLLDVRNACEDGVWMPPAPQDPLDPVHELAPPVSGLPFQNDNLNLAAACVRWFLKTRNTASWYHVMVRPAAYPALVRAAETFHTLPFGCFCEGGGTPHYHWILIEETTRRLSRWKGVKKQTLDSALHFVDVLGYVSQRHSLCDFTFGKARVDSRGAHHRYVARSLPPLHPFVLTLLWEGGFRAWLDRMLASLHPGVLVPAAFASRDLWLVRLSSLFGLDNKVALPVSDAFRRCRRETEWVLHGLDGERLYFEENRADGSAEQGESTLGDILGDAVYYPTPAQQTCLGLVKEVAEASERWEEKARAKETECEALERGLGKWKREKQVWKRKSQRGSKELKRLQYKHILLLEQENTYWRTKHAHQKQEGHKA